MRRGPRQLRRHRSARNGLPGSHWRRVALLAWPSPAACRLGSHPLHPISLSRLPSSWNFLRLRMTWWFPPTTEALLLPYLAPKLAHALRLPPASCSSRLCRGGNGPPRTQSPPGETTRGGPPRQAGLLRHVGMVGSMREVTWPSFALRGLHLGRVDGMPLTPPTRDILLGPPSWNGLNGWTPRRAVPTAAHFKI